MKQQIAPLSFRRFRDETIKLLRTYIGLVAALFLTSSNVYAKQVPEHWLDHDVFGKMRILLVCDSGVDDPLERMLPTMDWQGFDERDLVLVTIGPGSVEILNADRTRVFLSSDSLTQIHQKKRCNPGIDFNLIGKDGGVKRRWSDVVRIEDLFTTIDAMPMRRFEVRQKLDKN